MTLWEDDDPFLVDVEKLIKTHPVATQRNTVKAHSIPIKVGPTIKQKPLPENVIVPPASRFIERLDRLAASGDYDEVALAFETEILVYSWQTYRLRNVEWLIGRGALPIAFIAFKWHGTRLDLRIWHSPWQDSDDGSIVAAEWVLCSPRPDERTEFEIEQDWVGHEIA